MPNQWDLTGENIENTYQRVLQTPDGVNIFDGTGSAFTVTAVAAPAGPDQSIQFNDAGATSGSGNFIFDKINNIVNLTGSLIATSFTGSLQGTASWAYSASQALTASYYQETDPVFTAKSASLATTGSNTFIGNQVVSGSFIIETASSAAALRITQTGTGNAILVEDSANPDSTPFVVAADGRVGIGIASPLYDYKLHVRNGNVTNSTTWGGSVGVFENSGSNAYLSILSSDTYAAGIGFGTADHRVSANLNWNSTTKGFDLATNTASAFLTFGTDTGTERMRITSGGLVGIGTTTPQYLLDVNGSARITNSLIVTGSTISTLGFTGSLLGTASWAYSASQALTASYAQTASNILGGKATHVPFFITDTSLATSSIYQSGSSTVIINQDNATTANPEALYVWQPSQTSFNVISGKGNLNNYLQLNIQNTNQGVSASSDVVATANNGDESSNYIDMGINSENYSQNFVGAANDAYLYSTGRHLHIGNTSNFPVQIFAGGSDVDIHNKLELNPNNQHQMTGSLDISGSLNVRNNLTSSGLLTNGNNTILGNTIMSGSSTIQGTTIMTGSLNITGSTTQTGNNTLIGNTLLSGSIIVSGSQGPGSPTASVQIYGDIRQSGYHRFDPVTTNIDTSISASYIYVSGSTNDLYFSQNGNGYSNVTRLRWLEGNLYTGLLNGGIISQLTPTTYRVGSGSGIIVNLNASLTDNPYPVIQYLNWGNLTGDISAFTSSFQQVFVGIDSTNNIFAQGTPFSNGQFDTVINIGGIFFQNGSTINAVKTQPSTAYGFEQQQNIFNRAFGPLKLSGYTLSPSGSSAYGLVVGSGTAYAPGSNYAIDPNEPSYTVDNGTNISKIFRYRQSGSAWVYDTNGGAGYTEINPGQYSNNGVLTTVQPNDWSIQRVFWFPNSVVKAIVVYYGNQSYSTEADAIANVQFESFVEAPNTAANAIYLGAIIIRGNGVFTTPADFKIQPGGLFRQVGGAGGGGSIITQTLAGLSDVAISGQTNGQPLVYNSTAGKWVNQSTLIADLTGTATNATNAATASYISPTFISASAAASGFGSGGGDTSGLLTTASFNNYTGSNISQFAGTASFATTAQNLLGSVTTAQTASHAVNFTIEQTLTLDETLTDFAKVNSTIVGSDNLFQQATGSYTSAHGKYTLYKGANARAGEFVTVWNGTTTTYFDNATTDIGNTSDIVFQSEIITSQIQINAVAATSGWTVKMLVTYL